MIRSLWCLALAGAIAGVAWNQGAAAPKASAQSAAAPLPAEVSISNTRRIEFVSRVNGHRYAINVALPYEPCPKQGCEVLYVLDGDFYFGSATEAIRVGNATGVVVVGIGYSGKSQAAIELERMYDLSLPATDAELLAQREVTVQHLTSTTVGGVDAFLKTIETEVKPRVAALTTVDSTHQAIFGHSLSGLAVLHGLFTNPSAFRTYIIASPSIWWNDRAVLRDEPKFAAAVRAGGASPRVMLTVGADESTAPKVVPPTWGMNAAQAERVLRSARMVENASELAAWLKQLKGRPEYVVNYAVFEKQDHGISPWPALGRGISFAFPEFH